MIFSHRLQELLRCPNCHHDSLKMAEQAFVCPKCQNVYPITDGIVRLLAKSDDRLAQRAFSPLATKLYDVFAARGGFRWLYAGSIEKEVAKFTHGFHIQPDDVLVDVGCGTGNYTLEFAKQVHNGLAIGVDLSESMLKQLVKHARGMNNVVAIQANAENLPFKDGSIAKMFNGCLHHLAQDITPSLSEARRCVYGQFYGGTMFIAQSAPARWLQRISFIGQTTQPLDDERLTQALIVAGFEQITLEKGGIRTFFFGSYGAFPKKTSQSTFSNTTK